MWSIRLCGQHGCRTQLTSGYRQHSIHAKSEAARAGAIGRWLAGVVEFEPRQHELAEQAATDAAMGENAQKGRGFPIYFDTQADFVVADFHPAFGHSKAM